MLPLRETAMTEAEKLLQKLDKRSASWQVWIDDGEAIDITYSVDNMKVKQKIDCEAAALIRSQEAKIERMAEALREANILLHQYETAEWAKLFKQAAADLSADVTRLGQELAAAVAREAAKQAKIDALMLEYCPDEMTQEQLAEWAAHQKPSPDQPEFPSAADGDATRWRHGEPTEGGKS